MIYFDNAATTFPKFKEVYEALEYAGVNYAFNAGRGSYKRAKLTLDMIEDTRSKVSKLLNSTSDRVVFTSSATEALNNLIYGLIKEGDEVFISPFEHNAVVRALHNINAKINIIPFNKDLELDEVKFKDLLVIKQPKAIIISHISNVLGYMLPYEKIFSIGKKVNTINILDAAQSLGEYDIDINNIDIVVFAGHKSLYAMFGVAGYLNLTNVSLKTIKVGGTGSDSLNLDMPNIMPYRYEAGTNNSIAIYTLNKAIDVITKLDIKKHKEELTNYLISKLKEIPGIKLYLPKYSLPCGIVSFNYKDYIAYDIGSILADDYDICVRTGYHCVPFLNDFLDLNKNKGTIRVSFSYFNTFAEIDKLIDALKGME